MWKYEDAGHSLTRQSAESLMGIMKLGNWQQIEYSVILSDGTKMQSGTCTILSPSCILAVSLPGVEIFVLSARTTYAPGEGV
eukprot:12705425-Ditylum_brightwellii.AAC.1